MEALRRVDPVRHPLLSVGCAAKTAAMMRSTSLRVIHYLGSRSLLKPMCESTPNDDDVRKLNDELDEHLASLEGSQFDEDPRRPLRNNGPVSDERTVTGAQQSVAAVLGFLTAGPIGSLASWGAIRAVQGRWMFWFVIGVPSAMVINVFNLLALGVLIGGDESSVVSPAEPSPITQPQKPVKSPSSLPAYNASNIGGTTLVEKCQAIVAAQKQGNLLRVAQLSFQVGFEHDTPWNTDVDQDCEQVGVNTR